MSANGTGVISCGSLFQKPGFGVGVGVIQMVSMTLSYLSKLLE